MLQEVLQLAAPDAVDAKFVQEQLFETVKAVRKGLHDSFSKSMPFATLFFFHSLFVSLCPCLCLLAACLCSVRMRVVPVCSQ